MDTHVAQPPSMEQILQRNQPFLSVYLAGRVFNRGWCVCIASTFKPKSLTIYNEKLYYQWKVKEVKGWRK